MSIKVMTDVWAYADCSGSELLILLALADFSDDEGRNIYPSMQTLAHKARLSESQARRVVQNLVKKELIEIEEQGGFIAGRNRSNSYRINLEKLHEVGGSNLTPPPSRPRDHGGGADATTGVAPALDDPSYNHYNKPPLKQKRPTQGRAGSYANQPPHSGNRTFRPPADIDPLSH